MSHISHSGLVKYWFCPYSYKIRYLDEIKTSGNIYTSFGRAIHSTCEAIILNKASNISDFFKTEFEKELEEISQENKNKIFNPKNDKEKKLLPIFNDMKEKGATLAELAVESLKNQFKDFKIIEIETELFEPISSYAKNNYNFKGVVDLIIQTNDGKYHIIDWKSCSDGWNEEKRSNQFTLYQLSYYKHFYSIANNIEPENIDTWFILIKRTCLKNINEEYKINDIIEYVNSDNTKEKINDALKILNNTAYNIDHKRFLKNRASCTLCDYHKSEWCP